MWMFSFSSLSHLPPQPNVDRLHLLLAPSYLLLAPPRHPRQKEKRFPNRFHRKTTSASLSKRKGFRFSFAARDPPAT